MLISGHERKIGIVLKVLGERILGLLRVDATLAPYAPNHRR